VAPAGAWPVADTLAGMAGVARSFVDRSVEVLTESGAPRTTNELMHHAGHAGTVRSAAERLARDERLVRTGPNSWGLACWGARRYRPLDAVISDAAGAEPGGFRQVRRDRGSRPGPGW
jgi:hypothetical protein